MVAKLFFGRGGRPRGKDAGDDETTEGRAAAAGDPAPSPSVWAPLAWAGPRATRLFGLLTSLRSRRAMLVPAVATGGGTALALALGIFLSTASRATPPGPVTAAGQPSFEDEFLKTSDRKSIPAVPPTAVSPALIDDDVTALLAEPPVERARRPLPGRSVAGPTDRSLAPPPAGSQGRRTGAGPSAPPPPAVTAARPPAAPNHPPSPPGLPARGARPGLSPRLPPHAQPSDPDSVLPPTVP